jgi:hypothetical protein
MMIREEESEKRKAIDDCTSVHGGGVVGGAFRACVVGGCGVGGFYFGRTSRLYLYGL